MTTVQVTRSASLVQVTATRPQVAVGTPSVVAHNALTNRSDANQHPATAITFAPAGSVSAVTVQAAIAELDAEKQPLNAELTALAGLVSAADQLPYFTGAGTAALATLTAFGRSLIAAVDAPAAKVVLGLGLLASSVSGNTATIAGALTVPQTYTLPDASMTFAGQDIDNAFSLAQTFLGSVPGSPTAGQVLIGGGSVKTASHMEVGDGSGSITIRAYAAVTGSPELRFYRGGNIRWRIRTIGTETGSDTGGALDFLACTDAGATIDAPLTIVRAAGGAITLARPVACSSTLSATSLTASGLTSGRVPYVTTGGLLTDSATLAFGGTDFSLAPTDATVYSSSAAQGDLGARYVVNNLNNNNDRISQIVFRQRNSATYDSSIGASGGASAFLFFKVLGTERLSVSSALITASLPVTCTGVVTVPNGTAAAPGIRTTTYAHGLYGSSTSLGVAVNGVASMALNAPSGSAGAGWQLLTAADADYVYLYSDRTNVEMRIACGSGTTSGANINLFGSTHATANTGSLRHSTTSKFTWNATGIGFFAATPVARPSLAAATGTATRTTFDTTTVTTAQLAERVKALIDDLRAYGLEG